VEGDRIHIRNGFIQNNKDGIRIEGKSCVLEGLTWLNVGEDAVHIPSKGDGTGLRIDGCEFFGWDRDKAVQLNRAREVTVYDSTFVGLNCGIRWGDSEAGPHSGTSGDNYFIACKTAHHAAGKGTIRVSGDRYKGVPKPTKTTEGAKIIS
jgi:hypothetical protein